MSNATVALAFKISKRHEANYRDFLDTCDYYIRAGRIPHYCEHGTSRWTDYDNICGFCEDGLTMGDPMTRRSMALAEARERIEKSDKLADYAFGIMRVAPGINVDSIVAEMRRLREV